MIKKRGKYYHAIIYVNGKQQWRSTKKTKWRAAKEKENDLLKIANLSSENADWESFCKRYLQYSKVNHAEETYIRDNGTVNQFNKLISIHHLSQFSIGVMERYKELRQKKKIQPSTINRELGTLKAMANRAMEWNLLPEFNTRRIKKLKEVRKLKHYYEPVHIEALRAEILKKRVPLKKIRNPLKLRVLVDAVIYTGFRRAELAYLAWEDVDFEENWISVKSKPGRSIKDHEERKIRLHPRLKETLLKWREQSSHKLIFEGMDKKALSRKFKRLAQNAKMEGSIHTGRRTFITHLVRAVGIDQAKEAAGHSSVKTTERYSHQKSESVPVEVLKY